jgi:hypothetical protein
MVWKQLLRKTAFLTAFAGGILLLGGAFPAHASDQDTCRRNVEKWESHLNRDIDQHGVYSRQANHDRHELAEARENCERRYGNAWRGNYDFDHDGDRR